MSQIAKQTSSDIGLYWQLAVASIRAQMQYKVSFLLSTIAQIMASAIEIVGIWALFNRFGNLPDWSLAEVCVFYGLVNISFALSELVATGFDRLGSDFIRTGHFDRLLVRPRSLIVQLMGYELSLRRVGRLIQGLIVLIWAIIELQLSLSPLNFTLIIITIAGGVALFLGLFIFQATLSFWTVEK